jgi:hypothetical protein
VVMCVYTLSYLVKKTLENNVAWYSENSQAAGGRVSV